MGLFLDYENLAIGARDSLGLKRFDFAPIARAMAERGRVVYRRAYADWSDFDEDRRHLTRHQVELGEIPQRMGAARKNAADIKMVVDALELAFERDFVTTFVLCTGDSDFTPLVQKLRELDRRVIGIGVRDSTSNLLPPACDEFLFYDRLEGVEASREASRQAGSKAGESTDAVVQIENPSLEELVISTLAGMQGSHEDVRASTLKRAILRIDPTFTESDHGFRGFTELLRHLADRRPAECSGGQAQRVAVARALVNNPAIVLADEPTGNLDSRTSYEIMNLFVGLHKAGQTIIIVTHEDAIARYAHRVVRVLDGNIVEDKRQTPVTPPPPPAKDEEHEAHDSSDRPKADK